MQDREFKLELLAFCAVLPAKGEQPPWSYDSNALTELSDLHLECRRSPFSWGLIACAYMGDRPI